MFDVFTAGGDPDPHTDQCLAGSVLCDVAGNHRHADNVDRRVINAKDERVFAEHVGAIDGFKRHPDQREFVRVNVDFGAGFREPLGQVRCGLTRPGHAALHGSRGGFKLLHFARRTFGAGYLYQAVNAEQSCDPAARKEGDFLTLL